MSKFFEKLKKGMYAKITIVQEDDESHPLAPKELSEEELEEKVQENENPEGAKNAGIKNFILSNIQETEKKKKGGKEKALKIKENKAETTEKKWFEPDGQLVVDVYEAGDELIIQSAIAGINPDDLDITIENDMVSIKGKREKSYEKRGRNYFMEECYWGSFSREIILPQEVDAGKAEASMKNGVLTIRAPKIEKERKKIAVK